MEGREVDAPNPPNPALPYREDCWSEGETSVLVDAWGDRYLELNRGNLRQKHWQEVADAVNSRPSAGRRPARTDVQCKNRIDTLKKKYKVEKARISYGGESQWPFFFRLDVLIGSAPPTTKTPSSPPLALPLPFHRKGGTLLPAAIAVRPAEPKGKRPAATALAVDNPILRRAVAAAEAAAEDIKDEDDVGSASPSRSSSRSGRGWKKGREGERNGIRELARAISSFAEIYERVEGSKQRQMLELEKQRMEFTKTLEFQKMQLIVDTQVQIAKIKRAKRSGADSYL